jgi:tight adherence protein B
LLSGTSFLMLAVMLGVAVLLLVEGLYLLWLAYRGPEASQLKRRLRALSATSDSTSVLKQRLLGDSTWSERLLQAMPRVRELDRFLLQSGLGWPVGGLLLACLCSLVLGALLAQALLQLPGLAALAAGVVCALLPLVYVHLRRNRRLARIEAQLPDALDLITRALRAGHAFTSALKMSGEEMPEPIAGELRTVHDEINYGVSMQQALSHLAERVPLTDLRYFTVAVLIQRESGGNLTEILVNLSRLLRERARLLAKVRVLSSEGRLSAWILVVMPFGLAGLLKLFNPKFIDVLWTDPLGISMIKVLLTLMVIGGVIMRKIVRIRV